MTGYVRTDTVNNIADGNVISAADLDGEFNGVQAAFNSSTGHTHDGTASEGAPITKLGPSQNVTVSTIVLGVATTNTVDLGTSSLKFKDFYLAGNASIGGTLGVTSTATFTGAVIFNGNATIGDADTDTITQAASYVTGTQLKSAKTATNTLSLAAYDVDGTAYTNLITLTASNTPTLALTSTGVGTINNMSIGATTASTGAFTTLTSNGATTFTAGTASTTTGTGTLVITGGLGVSGRINAANFDGIVGANTAAAGSFTTLSASSTVTLSGGTANGVAYLDGSKVLTTGSALVFDGTNLGVGNAPAAWSLSGLSAVQVKDVSLAGFSNAMYLNNNVYYNGGWKFIGTGYGLQYTADRGTGAFSWNISTASGTAGNAISFTQAMTLDASGNLGIGTTTPANKLDVSGASGSLARFKSTGNYSTVIADNTSTTGGGAFAVYKQGVQVGLFGVSGAILGDTSTNIMIFTETGSDLNFATNGSGTPKARLSTNANGIFTVGNVGSVGALGGDYATIGAWGQNGGGLRIYRGTGAGTPIGTIYADGGGLFLSTNEAQPMMFSTNSTERARIDSSGNLGVGTTSPATKLDVNAGTTGRFRFTENSGTLIDHINGAASAFAASYQRAASYGWGIGSALPPTAMTLDSSGNLLVGTTSKLTGGVDGLDINTAGESGITFAKSGTVKNYFYLITNESAFQWQTVSGVAVNIISSTNGVTLANGGTSWGSLSDERKKDIIEPITDATTKVSSLRAVIGKYKTEEDGIRRTMLIAQDVQAVLPEAVVENADGDLILQYTDTIPLLVAAIKEQQALITQLTARITALEGA